jgi:DNA-binding MarR family transcriptional regulator
VTAPDCLADDVEVLQETTRMLAGIALRSLEVLNGAVTLPQFRVLATLAELGPVRSARAAAALGLEASTVTRLVSRLVEAGHVARNGDPTNRSAITIELTEAGRSLVTQVTAWRHRELERILLRLAPADRQALSRGLASLVRAGGGGYAAGAAHRLPL